MPPQLAQRLGVPHLAALSSTYPQLAFQVFATFEPADLGRREAEIAIRFQRSKDEHLVGEALPSFGTAIYATREYVER